MDNNKDFLIFAGNSNLQLVKEVCGILDKKLGDALVGKFSDQEIQIKINQSVRKRDVFVIQSTSEPANDFFMELFLLADALRRASANSITAVMPYFGYTRQDRKAEPRTPISASLMACFLTASGCTRVITFDLHAGQIQGFFSVPVDNLYASKIFLEYIKEHFANKMEDLIIVSPDAGGAPRARNYAKKLGINFAVIDKDREMPGKAKPMSVVGDVRGKIAIVIDDLVDTAGTLTDGAKLLFEEGAVKIYAMATHAVLSGPALRRINESVIENLVVTNTIPLGTKEVCQKIKVLSVAPLLAESIKRCHLGESITDLF
ncbi:MAG: ribose-phosphate pyrophosphokinase [Candidatus Falkowbacteria bacterium]|nr:ribose-phosphate pyrophosphokinase [Candidatus Falkowbacteria bacterium]